MLHQAKKSALRDEAKRRRRGISADRRQALSVAIAERVLRLPELARPCTVLAYWSVRGEVSTHLLIEHLVDAGHRVALPQTIDGALVPRLWQGELALTPGAFSIPYPTGPVVEDIDVVLTPGLAFNRQGARLGYGGGYYDRFLAGLPAIPVALAFTEQLVSDVPTTSHDVYMQAIVTPDAIYRRGLVRVVAAAVLRNNRVLAARRGPEMHLAGLWELPGGKVEPGEDDAAALARELREELGIQTRIDKHLAEAVHHYPAGSIHLVAYTAEIVRGEPEAREHSALRWVSGTELAGLDWAPADLPLLKSLASILSPNTWGSRER